MSRPIYGTDPRFIAPRRPITPDGIPEKLRTSERDPELLKRELGGSQIGEDVKEVGAVQQTRTSGVGAAVRMLPKDELTKLTPEQLDTYKEARLQSLGETPHAAAVFLLVDEANIAHKKAGHTQNVIALLETIMKDVPADQKDVLNAARFLNLADLQTPSQVLVGGKLSDEDFAKWIKPRAEMSAKLFEDLSLGSRAVAALIRTHKSGGAERPVEAQLLELADTVMGMAAKPFFADRNVLAEKLAPLANRFDPAVFQRVLAAVTDGTVDAALKTERKEDLWIR